MTAQPAEPQDDDRLVTVCSACLSASCWQAQFFCDEYQSAGTVRLPVSKLRELDREHPCYWKSDEELANG